MGKFIQNIKSDTPPPQIRINLLDFFLCLGENKWVNITAVIGILVLLSY